MPFFTGIRTANLNTNRFRVGGTGTWDTSTTTGWSYVSGGPGGAPVPTASNNVYINAGTGGGTITKTATTGCKNLDTEGFTGTFAGTGATPISGSLRWGTGITRTYSGAITFNATSGVNTVTTNGKGFQGSVTYNGIGGRWQLVDAYTATSAATTVTNGTLDTNGQTLNLNSFTKAAAASIVINNSTITTVTWSATAGAGTVSATNSSITTNQTFSGGGYTYNNVSVTGTNAAVNSATFNGNFSSTGGFTCSSNLTFNAGVTFSGTSQASRSLIASSGATLASVTFTCNGSAPVISNVDFQGIIAAGTAGTWSGTNVGNCQGNSNITFTPPSSPYFVGGATVRALNANFWSTSSGGAVGAPTPLPQDTPIFDANSFLAGGGIDVSGLRVPTLDFTNATNNPSLVIGTIGNSARFYGNVILKAGMSMTGNVSNQFLGYGITQILDMAGITYPGSIASNIRNNGTLQIASALNMGTRNITMTLGNLNCGASAVSCGNISFASGQSQTWTFSGNISLASTGAPLTTQATTTIVCTGGLIDITDTSAGTKNIRFGNGTYNNLRIRGAAGSVVALPELSNTTTTFNTITLDPLANFNPNTSNLTIRFNDLVANGSVGNLITMTSAQAYNFVSLSGNPVNVSYCAIDHSAASGATFTATNSVNNGGNSGWTITP